MASWWRDLWARWFGSSEPSPPALSARQLMEEMKAERAGAADPERWRQGLNTLSSRVFSGVDRARLWRRARRRYPGEVVELSLVDRPTEHDVAALEDLLRELERG